MHVDNELVEFMTVVGQEYEEEILIQEGALEPPATDFADTPPFQGKPRCITLFWISTEYIYDVYLRYRHFIETTCINISTYESY